MIVTDPDTAIVDQGFRELAIPMRNEPKAGALPGRRSDPVERMLVAGR